MAKAWRETVRIIRSLWKKINFRFSRIFFVECFIVIVFIGLIFSLFTITLSQSKRSNIIDEPNLSREYFKARKIYQKNKFSNALKLLEKIIENKKEKEDVPRALFLSGESYRKIAENIMKSSGLNWENVDGKVEFREFTNYDLYLNNAINYYTRVLNEFPMHFLADDALGWLGGCNFRKGKYLIALNYYLDVLEKYPNGDQAKQVDIDTKMCFQRIMKEWSDLDKNNKDLFFTTLNREVSKDIFWDFPKESWNKFGKEYSTEFLKILTNKGKTQDFFWSAGFASLVVNTHSLDQCSDDLLFDFTKESFFLGEYEIAFKTSEVLMNREISKEFKNKIENYFWISCFLTRGAKESFDSCLKYHLHNSLVVLSYDLINLNDLENFCVSLPKDYVELDMLKFILAMRYYAKKDFRKSLDILFQIVNLDNRSEFNHKAWKKILEIKYFFDLPDNYLYEMSNYELYLNNANQLNLQELEKRFWGKEFIDKNSTLLREIYREYDMFEKLIWNKRRTKSEPEEIKKLQNDFLKFVTISAARIKNAPAFNTVPQESKLALNGILEIVLNKRKYDFSGTKNRFSRQLSIMEQAFIPYIKGWKLINEEEFQSNIMPIVAILWNLSNFGKFQYLPDERLAYINYERGSFFCSDEIIFKRDIPIYESSWDPYLVDLITNFSERDFPLFLTGYNYVLAKEYFVSAIQKTKDQDLLKRAIFMLASSLEWYARTLQHSQSIWLQTLDIVARYVKIGENDYLFSNADPEELKKLGIFIPFSKDKEDYINDTISQYILFSTLFPKDKLIDDVFYNIGLIYEAKNMNREAREYYLMAKRFDDDKKKDAEIALHGLHNPEFDSGIEKNDVDAIKVWLELLKRNYRIIPSLIDSFEISEKNRNFPIITIAFGKAFLNISDFEKSRYFFEKYLKAEPDGEYVSYVLDGILKTATANNDYINIINFLKNYSENNLWLNYSFYKMAEGKCQEAISNWKEASACYLDLINSRCLKNEILAKIFLANSLRKEGKDTDSDEILISLKELMELKIFFNSEFIPVNNLINSN